MKITDIINFFKRKPKEATLKPLKVSSMPLSHRLRTLTVKTYTAKVSLTYQNKAIRVFDVTVKAKSRDHAAYKINQELGLQLLTVLRDKKRKL